MLTTRFDRCELVRAIALAGLVACAPARPRGEIPAPRPTHATEASTDDLVRLRCAHDGRDVVTTWRGEIHAIAPGAPAGRLFSIIGMNVARCERRDGRWFLTSRELMFYLDPETGERLDRWSNPWTQATVPVIHVANHRVQFPITGAVPIDVGRDGVATIPFAIPVRYPNPLAGDPATAVFSPAETYVAHEHFTFAASAAALHDATTAAVPSLAFTWQRVGPWLPWMAQGDRPGVLVYTARGRKLGGVAELPAILARAIAHELPLYRHAPRCLVDGRNETSWTYFARHVEAYRQGARFPLPAPAAPDECAPSNADRTETRNGRSSELVWTSRRVTVPERASSPARSPSMPSRPPDR